MGSASKWVEIPDIGKKQLTLSGVLLSAGREEQNDLQPTNVAYTPQPSSATRRFKKDGAVDFMVIAYNAKVEKNTADLVIFPERWDVAQHSLRPPYYHRNAATEFNAIVTGESDPERVFTRGGHFMTPPFTAHGISTDGYESAIAMEAAVSSPMSKTAR